MLLKVEEEGKALFRIKMYHEPGYWWQRDGVCDKSDIDDEKDPNWCLECEGSVCDDGDYALLQSCDRDDNTYFNLFPRGLETST